MTKEVFKGKIDEIISCTNKSGNEKSDAIIQIFNLYSQQVAKEAAADGFTAGYQFGLVTAGEYEGETPAIDIPDKTEYLNQTFGQPLQSKTKQ